MLTTKRALFVDWEEDKRTDFSEGDVKRAHHLTLIGSERSKSLICLFERRDGTFEVFFPGGGRGWTAVFTDLESAREFCELSLFLDYDHEHDIEASFARLALDLKASSSESRPLEDCCTCPDKIPEKKGPQVVN